MFHTEMVDNSLMIVEHKLVQRTEVWQQEEVFSSDYTIANSGITLAGRLNMCKCGIG